MIGQFVTSKAGHDKGTLYLVVAEEGDFAALCDGRLKLLESPKRKRKKHIQPICSTAGKELVQALEEKCATDEQIQYAISQYKALQNKI